MMENSLFQSFYEELLEFFFLFFPLIIWIKLHNRIMMDVIL